MPDFIEVGPAKFQRVYSYTTKQRLPPCDGVILGRVSRPPRRSASRSPKLFKLPPMQSLNDAAYWHGTLPIRDVRSRVAIGEKRTLNNRTQQSQFVSTRHS